MNKDITVQVASLGELMENLSSFEKETTGRTCVSVLDVFCPTWGSCNALKSTFKDIVLQEIDDQVVSIKFLQVNAAEVLNELKNRTSTEPPLTPRSAKRPLDLLRDILPDAWKDKFEAQLGKAKPLFLFYKDCQFISSIEGVNTPYIKRTIKSLIKEKKPASDFITNPALLELWSDQIGAAEPEAPWSKFCKAVNVWCLFPPDSPPFTDEEAKVLMQALKVEKGSMPVVTAKGVQDWVGDGKFEAVFHAALPGYEGRVAAERLRKEEEAKNPPQDTVQPPAGEKPADTSPAAGPEDGSGDKKEEKKEEEPVTHENVGKRVVEFDEGKEGVLLGSIKDLALGGSFTIAMWVYPAEGAGYEERTNDDLAMLGAGTTPEGDPVPYLTVSLRELKPCIAFSPSAPVLSEAALPEQQWSHIGVTFNTEDKAVVVYINAEAVAKSTIEGETQLEEDAKVLLGAAHYASDVKTIFSGRIAGLSVIGSVDEEHVQKKAEDKSLCTAATPREAPADEKADEVVSEQDKGAEEGGKDEGETPAEGGDDKEAADVEKEEKKEGNEGAKEEPKDEAKAEEETKEESKEESKEDAKEEAKEGAAKPEGEADLNATNDSYTDDVKEEEEKPAEEAKEEEPGKEASAEEEKKEEEKKEEEKEAEKPEEKAEEKTDDKKEEAGEEPKKEEEAEKEQAPEPKEEKPEAEAEPEGEGKGEEKPEEKAEEQTEEKKEAEGEETKAADPPAE